MAKKLTRRTTVILSILVFFVVAASAGFAVYYLNSQSQVGPGDADAGRCCNSFVCGNGESFGHDSNYAGANCSDRHVECDGSGVVEEGTQCSGTGSDSGGTECGGIGQACCQPGNGCASSLHCQGGVCDVSGGACNGTASCDENGCYCNPAGHNCNPVFSDFHCPVTNPNQVHLNCGDDNHSDAARNANVCKVVQYDVEQCNGNNASVVWIDANGTKCTQGYEECKAILDFEGCAPKAPKCVARVTPAPQCIEGGIRVAWNVALEDTTFDPAKDIVVIRIDNLRDTWPVAESDIYFATDYAAFVASGKNPLNATFDFTARAGIVANPATFTGFAPGSSYDITVSFRKDKTQGNSWDSLCASGKSRLTCESENAPPVCTSLTASSETIKNGDTVTLTSAATDPDGTVSDVKFYWAEDIGAPTPTNYCADNYTEIGFGVKNGNNYTYEWDVSGIPDSGSIYIFTNVRDNDGLYTTGNPSGTCNASNIGSASPNCKLKLDIPAENPDWTINKTGGSVCAADNSSAEVSYTITVANIGAGAGTINQIVDTLDAKVQAAWVSDISNGGTIAGNIITWDLSVDDALFDPGESKSFTYTVTVPSSGFGSYANNVEAMPSEGDTITDDLTIMVTCSSEGGPSCGAPCNPEGGSQCPTGHQCVEGVCQVDACVNRSDCTCQLPNTAVFDSAIGRVGAALILIGLGGLYMFYEKSDSYMLRVISRDERFLAKKSRFENKFGEEE